MPDICCLLFLQNHIGWWDRQNNACPSNVHILTCKTCDYVTLTYEGRESGFPIKKHYRLYWLNSYYGHKLFNAWGYINEEVGFSSGKK